MMAALHVMETMEGKLLIESNRSVEPFYAVATEIITTGKFEKTAIKSGMIIRAHSPVAACVKSYSVVQPVEAKKKSK